MAKKSSLNRKKKFKKKSWNIRNKRSFLPFLLSFLSCIMIEAKIITWPDVVLNYSEEIFKAIINGRRLRGIKGR